MIASQTLQSNTQIASFLPSHKKNLIPSNSRVLKVSNSTPLKISFGDVRQKHLLIKEAIKDKNYPRLICDLLEDITNRSDSNGQSRVSQSTLAHLISRSIDSVQRYLKILKQDGIIETEKNGWQKTNTIILLPIKNELSNKYRTMRHNLNNLNLKDLSTNKHYSGIDVSIFAEYEKEMSNAISSHHPPASTPEILSSPVHQVTSGIPKKPKPVAATSKKSLISKLFEIGLTLQNIKFILGLIKKLNIASEIINKAIESTKENKTIRNIGGYFYTVLIALHEDYERRKQREAEMSVREDLGYSNRPEKPDSSDRRATSEHSMHGNYNPDPRVNGLHSAMRKTIKTREIAASIANLPAEPPPREMGSVSEAIKAMKRMCSH